MFGVNLVYDAVDFNARVFQAYSLLRKQSIAADRGILNCQVGRWSPLNLWDGIRYGLTAVVATTVAVLVGKLLPITVSGLYTAHPGELLSPVSAAKNGSFDFGLTNFTDQESAAIMVLYTNTSYPKWTYEEFAFPTFELPTNITNLPFHEGYTVTMNTEGLRLNANCTALGKENVDLRNNQDSTGVQLNVHLPHHCNDFNKTWDFKYGYFGMANTAFPGQIAESRSFGPPPDVQGDCARWVMAAGYAQDYTLRNATVSALFCSPYFETVETKVTLQVPSLSVDPLNPPIVHEHTAKHVASFNNKTQIPEMEDDFANAVRQATVHKEFPYAADFDEFFTAVVAGRGGTPAQELVGAHNLPRLRKAVQHTCGIIEAQHANYKFRANSTGPDTAYHGTLRNPNRVRINAVCDLDAHSVLLGVMLLCGIVAYVTVETRRVLPKNPCSIGAVLSLLAGSPILTESVASPEAQWWNDDELKRNGVFQGWLVSLGWWKDGADGDRFGVGVGQAEWRK